MTGSHELELLVGDERLMAELLRGLPVAAAAEKAGMSESTARRRLQSPEFAGRLEDARRERASLLASLLTGGAEAGYRVLLEVALDRSVVAGARVRAAERLVEFAGRFGAIQDQGRAIEELRAELEEIREERREERRGRVAA
jgi:hypothetical protein